MAYNLPPTYDKIQKHAVFPELSHGEQARYNFLRIGDWLKTKV